MSAVGARPEDTLQLAADEHRAGGINAVDLED
jgi:hypothetical protein